VFTYEQIATTFVVLLAGMTAYEKISKFIKSFKDSAKEENILPSQLLTVEKQLVSLTEKVNNMEEHIDAINTQIVSVTADILTLDKLHNNTVKTLDKISDNVGELYNISKENAVRLAEFGAVSSTLSETNKSILEVIKKLV